MKLQRKVIQIRAEQSPNVRLALAEIASGKEASGREIVPGVVTYGQYLERLETWDEMMLAAGIHAEFYEGEQVKLFPPELLRASAAKADELASPRKPVGKTALGCDPAEGGDNTPWVVVDEMRVLEMVSLKTPDTNEIIGQTIALGKKWNIPAERWAFDRGGGGKEHADRLRSMGYPVQTVAFGESVTMQPRRGTKRFEERVEEKEERYVYKNRRAQMFHVLSLAVANGFAIPTAILDQITSKGRKSLRFQLSKMPKLYDAEGRIYLIPKNPPTPNYKGDTLVKLIGHSPDEADALAVAVYVRDLKPKRRKVGIVG